VTQPQQDGNIATKLLLVEGNDDLRFFHAMYQSLGISDVTVSSYNGKRNLGNDLSERVRSPGFQTVSSVGIVRDADESSHSAFDSVVGALRRVNLPIPDAPAIPIERNGLHVSVLIIPPEEKTGELENVCLGSIEGTPDMLCVESYFDCLSNVEPPIATNQIAKARLHSYLAPGPIRITQDGELARRQPALRLGEAAEAGVWDWSSPAFERVADFLRNL
jgi:hypothetical protein